MEYDILNCGCGATKRLDICPLHKAAPKMYGALKSINEYLTGANIPFSQVLFDAKKSIREALAEAEGKNG